MKFKDIWIKKDPDSKPQDQKPHISVGGTSVPVVPATQQHSSMSVSLPNQSENDGVDNEFNDEFENSLKNIQLPQGFVEFITLMDELEDTITDVKLRVKAALKHAIGHGISKEQIISFLTKELTTVQETANNIRNDIESQVAAKIKESATKVQSCLQQIEDIDNKITELQNQRAQLVSQKGSAEAENSVINQKKDKALSKLQSALNFQHNEINNLLSYVQQA